MIANWIENERFGPVLVKTRVLKLKTRSLNPSTAVEGLAFRRLRIEKVIALEYFSKTQCSPQSLREKGLKGHI